MALKLKYTDEHGIVHINMSPSASPRIDTDNTDPKFDIKDPRFDIKDPKFDSINNRFQQYDLFGAYDGGATSLFRSRYNSIEEELANTPYAFATERTLRSANKLDITIDRSDDKSPSKDIEDDRFFRRLSIDYDDVFRDGSSSDTPAFTVTQLIHAQDRYFDLSNRQDKVKDSFKVLKSDLKSAPAPVPEPVTIPVVPTTKNKREKSFAIIAEPPITSRPSSPRSLPFEIRHGKFSPFKGRGFREETSRHNTPKTSAGNSRHNSPLRRRTSSLSSIDNMATATLPPPIIIRPHSPRDFVRENIKDVREISEQNREKNEAEAEKKKIEEEEAIFKEMGLSEKEAHKEAVRSVQASRNNSRSNSPSKMNLRSRSNSPSTNLIDKRYINSNDGLPKPVAHRSRVRSVSKSQPQSNGGSPKHSKIPKRQNSVSPTRSKNNLTKKPSETNLNKNQKYMSNSTSKINESLKVTNQMQRGMSKSTQHLSIASALVKGKPPISPGRGGPPPSNKTINAKRLSPIVGTPSVGTPNKSPTEDPKDAKDSKAKFAKATNKLSSVTRRPMKANGIAPNGSKTTSRNTSREQSPDKTRKASAGKVSNPPSAQKTLTRTLGVLKTMQTTGSVGPNGRKPITRTDSNRSIKSIGKTAEKPPLKKVNSKSSLNKSNTSINEVGKVLKRTNSKEDNKPKQDNKSKQNITQVDSATDPDEIPKADSETQYDKITNAKGDLVIMTKKNIVSMTTAAITSQPLEIVTTVTNQLPVTFERAREKGIFERNSSKDSLTGRDEKAEQKDKAHPKKTFSEDNVKLKPLQPPYNDPQLERVKQKIDDILKTPEISKENILTASAKARETKLKGFLDKTKTAKTATSVFDQEKEKDTDSTSTTDTQPEVKQTKEEVKIEPPPKELKKEPEVLTEARTEATKIVDSIITPVEEPKPEKEEEKKEPLKEKKEPLKEKKDVEAAITVVQEKKNKEKEEEAERMEKVNEDLVKEEPDMEVQSSNVSTPGIGRLEAKMDGSDRSHSNGGFPQSTSTTPKPPARTKKEKKEKEKQVTEQSPTSEGDSKPDDVKRPNICSRLMGKCKTKCCPCCVKGEQDGEKETEEEEGRRKEDTPEKQGVMSKFSWCKKKTPVEESVERNVERAAGKGATIEFEDETKRKRKFRDIICCCGRRRRVTDASIPPQNVADVTMSPRVASDPVEQGCCGRRKTERRDSILSDRPKPNWCSRAARWARGLCRRRASPAPERRASVFSKNKSLSPTLPPEDTRKKLDPTLIEHTSMIRAAVPILPIVLAYFCLICNVVVPGLGSIFSGMFCLCFGIPRFGVHDGAKHRIASFVVNLLVGLLQLFTVLFCLVGWGWSIWWGVIMVKISRKYRKLRAESLLAEAEAAAAPPPVTANNHTRA